MMSEAEQEKQRNMEITREKISTFCRGDVSVAEADFQQKFRGCDMNGMVYMGEQHLRVLYERHFFLLDNVRIVVLEDYDYPEDCGNAIVRLDNKPDTLARWANDLKVAKKRRNSGLNSCDNRSKPVVITRRQRFFEIERFNLSTKGATYIQSDETYCGTNVTLQDDDGIITYELYPYKRGRETSLEMLLKLLGLDEDEAEELDTQSADDHTFLCRVDETTTVHVACHVEYSVRRNYWYVSSFVADDREYQLGSFDTRCFYVKSRSMLIIENRGDVPNVVIIHFNSGVILL
jgi:hypothetical protein